MILSCTYCGRLMLNEMVYTVHTEKCTMRHSKENISDESNTQLEVLATLIFNCSEDKKYITKVQLLKIIDFWLNNIHMNDQEQYHFVETMRDKIINHSQIVYSLNDRKKIIYHHRLSVTPTKENIVM